MIYEANDRGYYNLVRYNKIGEDGTWPDTGLYYTIGLLGGHIADRVIKPETIDRDDRIYPEGHGRTDSIGYMLRRGNIPDEARWFFVESVRVDRDKHKEAGHDDITKSPLDFLMKFMGSYVYAPLKGAYVEHFNNNEDYTTSVKGKDISRKRLSLYRNKVDDSWLNNFVLALENSSSLFAGQMAGFDVYGDMRQTVYDEHQSAGVDEGEFSSRRARLTMSEDRFASTRVNPPVLPLTIDWSFFKGKASTRDNSVLQYPRGSSGFNSILNPTGTGNDMLFDSLFPNSEILQGKMYPGFSTRSTTQNFGVESYVTNSPQLKRFKYSPPNFVLKQSSDEDSDYLMFNKNYAEAQRNSNMVSTIMEAAGLLNPFTFHATLARMLFITGPQTALSYLEEQARKDDAMNNYNGTDLPQKINHTDVNRQFAAFDSGETQTLTFNTQKQLITVDGEVSEIPEDRYIDIPVNKLFKKTSEFEEWVNSQPGYGILRSGYYRIRPYMNMGKYEKSYEHWARFK